MQGKKGTQYFQQGQRFSLPTTRWQNPITLWRLNFLCVCKKLCVRTASYKKMVIMLEYETK